jgi:hypothetical protein
MALRGGREHAEFGRGMPSGRACAWDSPHRRPSLDAEGGAGVRLNASADIVPLGFAQLNVPPTGSSPAQRRFRFGGSGNLVIQPSRMHAIRGRFVGWQKNPRRGASSIWAGLRAAGISSSCLHR